jgi:PAS domain S-box-containing protein
MGWNRNMRSEHQTGIVNGNGAMTKQALRASENGNGAMPKQALRASELSYRRLFETAKDGILILDVDTGRISDVNPFLIKLLGYSHGEMVGQTVGEISPFKDTVSNQAMLERLQKNGYVRYEDLPLETRDGRKIAVEFVSNVYQAGDKKVIQCNIRDITKRRAVEALRDSEEKFRGLFESSRDAIMTLGPPAWKFTSANPATVKMFGAKNEEEFISHHPWELSPDHQPDGRASAEKFREIIDTAMRERFHFFEWTHRRIGGEEFAADVLLTRMGRGIQANVSDITGRKLAEEQIERLSRFPSENPNPVLRVSARGVLEYANVAADTFRQTMRVEVGGTVSAEWQARIAETLAKEHPVNIEHQAGNQTFGVTLAPVVTQGYVNLYASDITGRKLAEAKLRESEERYRSVVENARDAIFTISRDGRLTSANPACEVLTGLRRDDWIGQPFALLAHPDDMARASEVFHRTLVGEKTPTTELRVRTGPGETVLLEFLSAPQIENGQVVSVLGIGRDITERKRAEEGLKQSEHRFREMLENLKLIAMTLDKQGKVTFCNDYLLQLTGHTREEIIGADWFEKFVPETEVAIKKIFLDTIETGAVPTHYQNPIKTASGERRDILWNNTMLRDGSGNIIGSASIGEDVTERKRAEESNVQLAAIVESSDDAIIGKDLNGIITNWNKGAEKIYGYMAGEVVGTSILRLIPADRRDEENQILETIKRGESMKHFETLRQTKDGRLIDVSVTASPIIDVTGKIIGVSKVARDITERRKLEAQFRQSQKMEAVGQLAGGVAHDFNNILAIIQMQLGLLKGDSDLLPEQAKYADEIGATVERAAALTRQLLIFSRKERIRQDVLDLNETIKGIAKMLRRIIGEDIQLELKFDMQSLFIHADAGMMDQVLLNLAVNARDAMPKGGQLVIETSAVDFDESVRAQSGRAGSGSLVCLSVSDTGCGIPPEILPRIFEPFFTTKEASKGTGLGLATVFGIVEQHQGWINVQSEVGHGTTFHIYLPQLTKISQQKPEQPTLSVMRGGTETIMLVEDDASLRASVRKTLSQLGYRVLEAVNGVEALEVWKQNRAGIHLLLTDLIMPGGLTGRDLGERLLTENSKLKVIYASGYSGEIAGKDFPLEEGVNFLTKPFQAQKLAQIVRNRLDRN